MKRGFTLIELLVVIAILSLLSSIVIAALAPARAKARDSKRVQDLIQLRNALELYKAQNGRYPDDKEVGAAQGAGFDCWECNIISPSTCDSAHPGCSFQSPYTARKLLTDLNPFLKTLPSDPSVPPSTKYFNDTTGVWGTAPQDRRGYWYKTDPGGVNYKIVVAGTIGNINNIPEPMRDMAPWSTNANYLNRTAAIYSSELSKLWTETCVFPPAGGTRCNGF
ncbi:MAG: prepilin-type N-terminal cleavage/methylation domain-containing protein [Patescibacteria group bacterium]